MNELAQLIDRFERWTGLDLRRGSSYAALERYVRLQLPADDPTALARYLDDLTTPHHPEAVRLVNAITVCHSSFYRDPEQLSGLAAVLRVESSRRANVWVPACATGEDPYTIALIAESLSRPVSILATDINTRALEHATAGIYGPWSVRDLPPSMALPRRADGRYEVPARLRRVITFARHNLMDVTPSSPEGWDVIVCRNVLMYIGRERVIEVLQRLAASLRPGGYLFVGANDIFERAPPLLRFVRLGQRHVLWRPPAPMPGSSEVQTPPAGVLTATTAPVLLPPSLAPAPAIAMPPPMPAIAIPAPVPATLATSTGSFPALSATPPLLPTPAPSPAPAPSQTGTLAGSPALFAGATASPARAHGLMLEGNTAAALELVLAVLEADPLSVEARLIAGIAYQLAGDAQQATTALRAALVLAPDLWPAEMYLGFALFQLGDEPGARRALGRGAQLAAANERLPLSPSVATWFEGWRVDAIEMGRQGGRRMRTPSG